MSVLFGAKYDSKTSALTLNPPSATKYLNRVKLVMTHGNQIRHKINSWWFNFGGAWVDLEWWKRFVVILLSFASKVLSKLMKCFYMMNRGDILRFDLMVFRNLVYSNINNRNDLLTPRHRKD